MAAPTALKTPRSWGRRTRPAGNTTVPAAMSSPRRLMLRPGGPPRSPSLIAVHPGRLDRDDRVGTRGQGGAGRDLDGFGRTDGHLAAEARSRPPHAAEARPACRPRRRSSLRSEWRSHPSPLDRTGAPARRRDLDRQDTRPHASASAISSLSSGIDPFDDPGRQLRTLVRVLNPLIRGSPP